MKKRIIFAIATSFFAVATVFNMGMLQSNNSNEISLNAITVMAQAQEESGGGTPTYDCPGGPRECAKITRGNEVHIFYMP